MSDAIGVPNAEDVPAMVTPVRKEGKGDSLGEDSLTEEYEEVADSTYMDQDSAIGGLGSQPASVYTGVSSLGEIVEENGRTYHLYKDGKYMLPNDEVELNRLDMQHKMWSITLNGKFHLAPIDPTPSNVLDIGTGTGLWAIEFAEAYPSAQVIGTDLSPVQPKYVPPNLQFEIDDAEDEWIFPMKFDYIHGRALATCFADPASVIGKAYDALTPGGYLELQDMALQRSDDESMRGSALEEWQTHVKEAGAKIGRVWTNVPNYERWMVEKGFKDVTVHSFRWPSNQWSSDRREQLLGAWTQAQIDNGMLESVSTRVFMKLLGWPKEKLDAFLSDVRRDSKDPNIKAYSPITVVYGRKPLDV